MAWYLVAEVMDKEPPLGAVIILALAAAVFGCLAAKIRWWLSMLASISALVLAAAILSELWDPFVGPAIRKEAGPWLFGLANLASVVSVVAPAVAAFVAWRGASSRFRPEDGGA